VKVFLGGRDVDGYLGRTERLRWSREELVLQDFVQNLHLIGGSSFLCLLGCLEGLIICLWH